MADLDFIYQKDVRNFGFWCSATRAKDVVQNWKSFWTEQLTALGGSPANKEFAQLEIEFTNIVLGLYDQPLPTRISLYDQRKAFYKFLCYSVGLSTAGQLSELFLRLFGEDVFVPLKYTDGSSKLFHCGFNACSYNEIGLNCSDLILPMTLLHSSNKTYLGLSADSAKHLTWSQTLPVVADFSALTVRFYGVFNNINVLTKGPRNGGDITADNGAWAMYKNVADRIVFTIYDGILQRMVTSDAAQNDKNIEIKAVVDGTSLKLYINGVEQVDTATLAAAPAYFTDDAMYLGAASGGFIGSAYELSVDAEVL